MERVAFLVEATGERIDCMLNPETVVLRRVAGVKQRLSVSGHLTGVDLSDDPLLYTGGGHTELELDLLFDLDLDPQTPYQSVRRLTERIWQLAENTANVGRYGSPPLVRFVWGKEWNLLGVVTAVAERFERFTPAGEPHRSWLSIRFVRVHDPEPRPVSSSGSTLELDGAGGRSGPLRDLLPSTVPPEIASSAHLEAAHTLLGDGIAGETLPQISQAYYGNPDLWWLVAWFNDIGHPLQLAAGTTLLIPSLDILEQLGQWVSSSSLS
jgi:hypothetical protein